MVSQLRKIYLTAYRSIGFVMLFCISTAIVVFLSLMIFFMIDSNWIAPTVLSPTSDKMLTFQGSLLTEMQTKSTIEIQHLTAQRAVESLTKQRDQLVAFAGNLSKAIHSEAGAGQHFAAAKRTQLKMTTDLSGRVLRSESEIQKSLDAGLLTQTEATQALMAIAQFRAMATDAELSADTLTRQQSTLSGGTQAVDGMVAQRQLIDLDSQINAANDSIVVQQKTLTETEAALKHTNIVMSTLQDTAYMNILTTGGGNLAFLAYDNVSGAVPGAPVYSCYLTIVLCHEVGTIKKVYKDEQIVDFPIFNVRFSRTVRGTLLALDLKEEAAMHSTILFFGHKPLLF